MLLKLKNIIGIKENKSKLNIDIFVLVSETVYFYFN